jgi:hypothetical protein
MNTHPSYLPVQRMQPEIPPASHSSAAPEIHGIKVTWWRLLNTAIPLGFGTCKFSLSLNGVSAAPTNIDYALGVLWALM